MAVDGAGNLIVADIGTDRVRVVAASTGTFYGQAVTAGDIETVAGGGSVGDDGPAASATLSIPTGVAVDGTGDFVIADSWDNCVRVVAGVSGTFLGQPVTAGDISTVAGACGGIQSFSGDGGPAASAGLADPTATAFDRAGNLAITDTANDRIRVVAASSGTFYGQAMTAGDIYPVAGSGPSGSESPATTGSGGPATAATFSDPAGIAVDGAGNLIVVGLGTEVVVAATSGSFYGQAMTAGDLYSVGPAFGGAYGVAVDGSGNLVLAEGSEVQVLAGSSGTFYGQAMTAGHLSTVAGSGSAFQGPGDGGPALDSVSRSRPGWRWTGRGTCWWPTPPTV